MNNDHFHSFFHKTVDAMNSNKDRIDTILSDIITENLLPNKKHKPTSDNLPPLTKQETKELEISKIFTDIFSTYLCLTNIEVYISRFPYSKTVVSRSDYLQYHYNSYLNEINIIEKRLMKYIKKVQRTYKTYPNIKAITISLEKDVKSAFKPIVDIRNNHTHSERFRHDKLSSLRFFETIRDADHLFESQYMRKFREARSELKKQIARNNNKLKIVLNHIFKNLDTIVFDKNGNYRPIT